MTRNKQLSKNFYLNEFGQEPHPALLSILQCSRDAYGLRHRITSGARSFRQQFIIYRNRYGSAWEKYIAWNSKHLPQWSRDNPKRKSYLLAVDLVVQEENGNCVPGSDLFCTIMNNKCSVLVGIGIAPNGIHLQLNFHEDTHWSYDYEWRKILG